MAYPSALAPVVLVVDDDPAIRTVFTRTLRLHGFRAFEAIGTEDATALADQIPFQAFIIDLRLSGESGLKVLAWLRRQDSYRSTPVVITTGEVALSKEEQGFVQFHRAHIFHKGQSPRVLVEQLQRLLNPSSDDGN